MGKRDRSVRTKLQQLQRWLILPIVYLALKPILLVADRLGVVTRAAGLASRLQYGRDPWAKAW